MYQIKWDQVIPQILPKLIDRRLVRAHGSFFDCRFILDFEDKSAIQFQSDDLLHREAIEFEIILNRQKIYNPLHFDSTHVFTNNLGKIRNAQELRTSKRNNVREICIYFDAEKKFNVLTQTIVAATRYNQYRFDEVISETITSFLQPRCDKMTIRTFRKMWHKLKRYEPSNIEQVTKHEELIKSLYHDQSAKDNSKDINYKQSVKNLYPIQSAEGNDDDINRNQGDIVRNLYPIGNVNGNTTGNTTGNTNGNVTGNTNNNGMIPTNEPNGGHHYERESAERLKSKMCSDSKSKEKEYDKVYCDVVCRLSSWMTYTATAKKKKY